MQNQITQLKGSLVDQAKKQAVKKSKAALFQILPTRKARPSKTGSQEQGGYGMHRKLTIERTQFEFNADINEVVKRFVRAHQTHILTEQKEGETGLVEGDASGFVNLIRRKVDLISSGETKSGQSITIPNSTFYLNEKSRDVYDKYSIFLLNLLHQMGFSSAKVVKGYQAGSNENKFIFIVFLLQWLAAQTLSQHQEEGYTGLLESFAGNLLLESQLLCRKGWVSASKSKMYSILIAQQPKFISLIKARRSEEALSKSAVKSINNGLNTLDGYEKTLTCFLMAKVSHLYGGKHKIVPKDLDTKLYKASFQRLYQNFVGSENCIEKRDLDKLHSSVRNTKEYLSSKEELDYLFNLLKDIEVLRRLLNALASLHETTGWLVLGLKSSVNLKALQAAFNCFHKRFNQSDTILQSIISNYSHEKQSTSVCSELERLWSQKNQGVINLNFSSISSDEVLDYVRKEIKGAMLELEDAQHLMVERGLSCESIFLPTYALQKTFQPNLPSVEVRPIIHRITESNTSSFSTSYAPFFMATLMGGVVIGAYYLLPLVTTCSIPPLAFIAAACILILLTFALCKLFSTKKTVVESHSEYSQIRQSESTQTSQSLTLTSPQSRCEILKSKLSDTLRQLRCDNPNKSQGLVAEFMEDSIGEYFHQYDVRQSPESRDEELWSLLEELRDECMKHTNNKPLYSHSLTLSTAINLKNAGKLNDAISCLLEPPIETDSLTTQAREERNFSPVIY